MSNTVWSSEAVKRWEQREAASAKWAIDFQSRTRPQLMAVVDDIVADIRKKQENANG